MTLTSDFNPNASVPFSRLRYMMQESGGGLQAGVVSSGDFMVTQRGAGAFMSVDVATGGAWVAVSGTRNGLAHCFNDATANVTITAAHATLPRIDQILLRYNDSSIPTGSGDVPTLEVSTGTATSGATLNNRTGATTPTGSFLRLADVLVAAADTSITNSEIRDRRPWARGAYARIILTSGAKTTSSTSLALIDSTNLNPRIECSGAPLRWTLRGRARHSAAGSFVVFAPWLDGAAAEPSSADMLNATTSTAGSDPSYVNLGWDFVPAAGSHLVGWAWRTNAATATLDASAGTPLEMIVEEIVRQNTANNTTTTG